MTVEKTIKLEIPEQWVRDLEWDQAAMIQEIIRLGIYQFRMKRALELLRAGVGSLGYVAEQTGVTKRDLIREARARGIEPILDEQAIREDLTG